MWNQILKVNWLSEPNLNVKIGTFILRFIDMSVSMSHGSGEATNRAFLIPFSCSACAVFPLLTKKHRRNL